VNPGSGATVVASLGTASTGEMDRTVLAVAPEENPAAKTRHALGYVIE
jgi:hypothetical protein